MHSLYIAERFQAYGYFLVLFFFYQNLYTQDLIPPSCYGGEKQFNDFFKAEVVYPPKALSAKQGGIVVLSFIVNADGSTRELKVWQSVSPALDREAVRIFKLLQWHPAVYNGKAHAMEYFLKFKFNPKKYRGICRERGYNAIIYPFEPVDSSGIIYSYKEVSILPSFRGTISDTLHFDDYFNKKMKYPETAFKQNISGEVRISFIVETSGRISNVRILKPLGGGCSAEVRRFFHKTYWMPGVLDGKAVRVEMKFAVRFEIRDGYQYISYKNIS